MIRLRLNGHRREGETGYKHWHLKSKIMSSVLDTGIGTFTGKIVGQLVFRSVKVKGPKPGDVH